MINCFKIESRECIFWNFYNYEICIENFYFYGLSILLIIVFGRGRVL